MVKTVKKDPVQYALVVKLASLKEKIAAREVNFAGSLVANFNKYGRLSDKQMYYVNQIINRAQTPAAPVEVIQLNASRINDMFDSAYNTLKRVKVTLRDSDNQKVVFKRATSASKYGGQIMVSDGGAFGEAKFFGRIQHDGTYVPTPRATESVRNLIKEFAADPEDTAGKYGRLTGGCCFCNKSLDDERSVKVGYGPVCAKRFSLRWGK